MKQFIYTYIEAQINFEILIYGLNQVLFWFSFVSYPLIFVKHGFYKSFNLLHLKFL